MLAQFLRNSDVHSCKRVWLISALRRMQRDLLSLEEGGITQKFKICFSFHPHLMRLKKIYLKNIYLHHPSNSHDLLCLEKEYVQYLLLTNSPP